MNRLSLLLAAPLLLACLGPTPLHAQIAQDATETIPLTLGTYDVTPSQPWIGQVFTAFTQNGGQPGFLTTFSMRHDMAYSGVSEADYYLYEWDPFAEAIKGPAIWHKTSMGGGQLWLEPGGIFHPLTLGSHYLFLVKYSTNPRDFQTVLNDPPGKYSGGYMVYGDNVTSLTVDKTRDIRFGFNSHSHLIDAVPEPSTWILLGTGLLGVAVAARRRGAES